jgi:hypothetical protein
MKTGLKTKLKIFHLYPLHFYNGLILYTFFPLSSNFPYLLLFYFFFQYDFFYDSLIFLRFS